MDRKLTNRPPSKIILFKEFEYLDLFPYSIALMLLSASIYILNAFVSIAHSMQ